MAHLLQVTPFELVGVAGFEPAASSSRTQVPAGTASAAARGLRQTVRGCPLTSTVGRGDCHSLRHSVVRARTAVGLTATATATMTGRLTAAREPRASMRARSYHASPGGCKASVLWIGLWMLSANRLVKRCEAVDEQGCGKVDNREDASLALGREASAVHKRNEVSTVQPVSSVIPATGMLADLPFFRCSGCPAQARTCESSWLLRVASGCWRLPSLPSRLPSEITADLPLLRRHRRSRQDQRPTRCMSCSSGVVPSGSGLVGAAIQPVVYRAPPWALCAKYP